MTTTLSISNQSAPTHWQSATWQDYLNYRDDPEPKMISYRLFFNLNRFLITDMGGEGLNHSKFSDLLFLIISLWSMQSPGQEFTSCGRCTLEKPETRSAAPDLVFYSDADAPVWQEGERRFINLDQWRVPNLVGEISDTTLSSDLDEKKQLYSALGIPEYWVVSVRGREIFVFLLQEDGKYQESSESQFFSGLKIDLLNEALEQFHQSQSTIKIAQWFSQQIQPTT